MVNDELLFVWLKIATVVRQSSDGLNVIVDEPGDLRIKTNCGRPFVSVRKQKGHVGVYLLPVYYHPEVLPQSLRASKTGKGTLRFHEEQDRLIDDMPKLIERCRAMIGHY